MSKFAKMTSHTDLVSLVGTAWMLEVVPAHAWPLRVAQMTPLQVVKRNEDVCQCRRPSRSLEGEPGEVGRRWPACKTIPSDECVARQSIMLYLELLAQDARQTSDWSQSWDWFHCLPLPTGLGSIISSTVTFLSRKFRIRRLQRHLQHRLQASFLSCPWDSQGAWDWQHWPASYLWILECWGAHIGCSGMTPFSFAIFLLRSSAAWNELTWSLVVSFSCLLQSVLGTTRFGLKSILNINEWTQQIFWLLSLQEHLVSITPHLSGKGSILSKFSRHWSLPAMVIWGSRYATLKVSVWWNKALYTACCSSTICMICRTSTSPLVTVRYL